MPPFQVTVVRIEDGNVAKGGNLVGGNWVAAISRPPMGIGYASGDQALRPAWSPLSALSAKDRHAPSQTRSWRFRSCPPERGSNVHRVQPSGFRQRRVDTQRGSRMLWARRA